MKRLFALTSFATLVLSQNATSTADSPTNPSGLNEHELNIIFFLATMLGISVFVGGIAYCSSNSINLHTSRTTRQQNPQVHPEPQRDPMANPFADSNSLVIDSTQTLRPIPAPRPLRRYSADRIIQRHIAVSVSQVEEESITLAP